MRCDKARKLASLPGGSPREVDMHIRACPACLEWLRAVSAIDEIHRSLPVLEAPEGLTGRILDQVAETGQESGRGTWKFLVSAAAAAFVALGIYAGSLIGDSMLGPPEPHYSAMTGLEYLEAYPPESVGEALDLAARGEQDE